MTKKKSVVDVLAADAPAVAPQVQAEPEITITSYKGFGPTWKCRDFQYALGKSYEHKGDVKACEFGFHACEYPLDIFAYYSPAGSRFAIVEQSGVLSRNGGDSKVASSKIKVSAEINFAGLIKAAIEYTTSRCTPVDPESPASATGYQGVASATGDQGVASATGNRGVASATGYRGVAMASGYKGSASGDAGNALFLVFRDVNYNIIHAKAAIVGRDGIKANTFYRLD
jgi:hypothetical protein